MFLHFNLLEDCIMSKCTRATCSNFCSNTYNAIWREAPKYWNAFTKSTAGTLLTTQAANAWKQVQNCFQYHAPLPNQTYINQTTGITLTGKVHELADQREGLLRKATLLKSLNNLATPLFAVLGVSMSLWRQSLIGWAAVPLAFIVHAANEAQIEKSYSKSANKLLNDMALPG